MSVQPWLPGGVPAAELAAGPLVLRRWRLAELDELAAAVERNRDHLARWLAWAATSDRAAALGFLLSSEAAFEARTDFGFALREPDGTLVGGAGLHARRGAGVLEIGYWVAADRANRGYATAAARALTDAGLALPGVERIEIHCDEANLASAAVPRKLGYRLDRVVDEPTGLAPASGRLMIWVFA